MTRVEELAALAAAALSADPGPNPSAWGGPERARLLGNLPVETVAALCEVARADEGLNHAVSSCLDELCSCHCPDSHYPMCAVYSIAIALARSEAALVSLEDREVQAEDLGEPSLMFTEGDERRALKGRQPEAPANPTTWDGPND